MAALNLSKFRELRVASRTLSEFFRNMTNASACVELACLFSESELQMTSDSIVKVLDSHRDGIYAHDSQGKRIPVRSVFDHPMLEALHRDALNDEAKFQKQLAEYEAWKASGSQGPPPRTKLPVGVQAFTDMRHFQSHKI